MQRMLKLRTWSNFTGEPVADRSYDSPRRFAHGRNAHCHAVRTISRLRNHIRSMDRIEPELPTRAIGGKLNANCSMRGGTVAPSPIGESELFKMHGRMPDELSQRERPSRIPGHTCE